MTERLDIASLLIGWGASLWVLRTWKGLDQFRTTTTRMIASQISGEDIQHALNLHWVDVQRKRSLRLETTPEGGWAANPTMGDFHIARHRVGPIAVHGNFLSPPRAVGICVRVIYDSRRFFSSCPLSHRSWRYDYHYGPRRRTESVQTLFADHNQQLGD